MTEAPFCYGGTIAHHAIRTGQALPEIVILPIVRLAKRTAYVGGKEGPKLLPCPTLAVERQILTPALPGVFQVPEIMHIKKPLTFSGHLPCLKHRGKAPGKSPRLAPQTMVHLSPDGGGRVALPQGIQPPE
jgi:hypothetical protein